MGGLRGIIEAQAAYIAELDTAIAAAKANLAALRGQLAAHTKKSVQLKWCVCGKKLRGKWRANSMEG